MLHIFTCAYALFHSVYCALKKAPVYAETRWRQYIENIPSKTVKFKYMSMSVTKFSDSDIDTDEAELMLQAEDFPPDSPILLNTVFSRSDAALV